MGDVEIFGDSPPSSRRCGFCLQDVGPEPSTACPKCLAVYHPDCWAANDRKCAIYGCVPAPAPVPERPRVVVLPVAERATASSGGGFGRGAGIFAMIVAINIVRYLGTCHSSNHSPPPPELRYRDFDITRYRTIPPPRPRGVDDDIEDANSLLERNHGNAKAYFARGAALRRKGDLPGALRDFDEAIQLDPRSGPAYHLRGHVRVDLQDLEGAVSDFGKAWAFDPREPESIYDRGCASYDLHAWEDCLKDFAQAYEKIPSLRSYAQIRFCLARSRMGQRAAAERDLAQFLERRPDADPWLGELLRFVAGLSNEELLFAEAAQDPRERLCQANYYAGTLRLLDGDEEQARAYFNTCLETGSTQYREYASADAELRALDKK